MVIVHEHPLSPYAQKVKIALGEKGIVFETRMPDILSGDLGPFARLNPRLEVPALEDGDVAVFDSTIILEYLEDRWPTPSLLPREPGARARARMIEDQCDGYVEALNWAVMEIRVFQRATGAEAERLLARIAEQWAGVRVWLERELAGRSWLNGDTFGWADLSVVPHVHAADGLGYGPAAGSPLAEWLARARARPAVAAATAAAAAAMTGFEMLPQLVQSGLFKREYRDHRLEWMLRSGGTAIVLEGLERGNLRFSREID